MSRQIVEVADYNSAGTSPLPGNLGNGIVNSPIHASLYPMTLTMQLWHEFNFRAQRLFCVEANSMRTYDMDTGTLSDYPFFLASDCSRHIDWDYAGYVPAEYELVKWGGSQVSGFLSPSDFGAQQWITIGHNWPPSNNDGFVTGQWPPLFDTILNTPFGFSGLSNLTAEITNLPGGALTSGADGSVRPLIYFYMTLGATRLTNVFIPSESLADGFYRVESQTRLRIRGAAYDSFWGDTPIHLYHPTTSPGMLDLVSPTGFLTIKPSLYFERRDANGANPVWDAITGEQLIFPIPTNTDR